MQKNILARIEEEDRKHHYWIVGPKTGHMLYWLIRVAEPKTVLEIGTSVGYSAIWMASALRENGHGRLWTVESHDERYKMAKQNIQEAGLSDLVVQIKGHAPEVIFEDPSVPIHIDFAFLDATKKEHQEYFDAIFPLMGSGGMIVVDNVLSHRKDGLGTFIEKTHENTGLKVVEIPVGNGLLIARVV